MRKATTPTVKGSQHALVNADVLFLVSQMLPGEYSISTFPLICRSTAAGRLYLNLCSCSAFSSSSASSPVHWTKETFLVSIPSRHWIHSLQLSGSETSNLTWLTTLAPKMENLMIMDQSIKSNMKIDLDCLIASGLKTLKFSQLFPEETDSLRKLPHLANLSIDTLHGREAVVLDALWENTTLVSLCIESLQLPSSNSDRPHTPPNPRGTPPKFGETLRELQCNENSTMNELSDYCWQLTKLKCATYHARLAKGFPNLIELIIGSYASTEIPLQSSLQKLCLQFEVPCGVIQGSCPLLKHGKFRHVDPKSLGELLATCGSLETLDLGDIKSADQEKYVQILTCLSFPQPLTVQWDGLESHWMLELMESGVQFDASYVMNFTYSKKGNFNKLPSQYRHKCASLDLGLLEVAHVDALPTAMTALTSLRCSVASIVDLQQFLTDIPSLIDVNVRITRWEGNITLHSRELRRLDIGLGNLRSTMTEGSYDFYLPKLSVLKISFGKNGVFVGRLLSELLSDRDHIGLPMLQYLTASTSGWDHSGKNEAKCRIGHPHLRELVLTRMRWVSFQLRNLPCLRKIEVDSTPKEDLWLDVPARCSIQFGPVFIKPSLPANMDDRHLSEIDFPLLSTVMLRVWGLKSSEDAISSFCPICKPRQKHVKGCKHGVVVLDREKSTPNLKHIEMRIGVDLVQPKHNEKCDIL